MEVLSETEGQNWGWAEGDVPGRDESGRDKEINCQKEAANPERQRKEHGCTWTLLLPGPREAKASSERERRAAEQRQSAQERWWP